MFLTATIQPSLPPGPDAKNTVLRKETAFPFRHLGFWFFLYCHFCISVPKPSHNCWHRSDQPYSPARSHAQDGSLSWAPPPGLGGQLHHWGGSRCQGPANPTPCGARGSGQGRRHRGSLPPARPRLREPPAGHTHPHTPTAESTDTLPGAHKKGGEERGAGESGSWVAGAWKRRDGLPEPGPAPARAAPGAPLRRAMPTAPASLCYVMFYSVTRLNEILLKTETIKQKETNTFRVIFVSVEASLLTLSSL